MGRKGFSLVELLVALAVASVLVSVAVVNYSRLRGQNLDTVAAAFGSQVSQALAAYLGVYIHVSGLSLLDHIARNNLLPAGSWSGFPGPIPPLTLARSCAASFTLPLPADPPSTGFTASPSRFGWGNPPSGRVRCVLGHNPSTSRLEVYTWRDGAPSGKYFINGQSP